MKTKLILLLLALFIISGCGKEDPTPEQKDYQSEIDNLRNRLEQTESRLDTVEANQLSTEELINLFSLGDNFNATDYDIEDGCPSKRDVIRWTDRFAEGDLSISKLNKIIDLYNDCS